MRNIGYWHPRLLGVGGESSRHLLDLWHLTPALSPSRERQIGVGRDAERETRCTHRAQATLLSARLPCGCAHTVHSRSNALDKQQAKARLPLRIPPAPTFAYHGMGRGPG